MMSRFGESILAADSFRQWDRERLERRNQYWQAINRARREYLDQYVGIYDLTVRPALHYWMQEHYGIRMGIDDQGNYTRDFEILDERRYLMFQLKYLS